LGFGFDLTFEPWHLTLLFCGRAEGLKITLSQSIFLGVIQGLTEFLPISSSAHLVFFQSLLGLNEVPLFFNVMFHSGTLLAVVIYFRNDLWMILRGIGAAMKGKKEGREGAKLFLLIVIASIPTGLIGFFLKDWFESLFHRPRLVGVMLLVTGGLLALTHWMNKKERPFARMGWIDAFLIGIAQGLAIIPGISRSGATISTGLFLGLNRELSGRFSFLLSIPAIVGATFIEFQTIGYGNEVWISLAGTAAAFVVGLLTLPFLMSVIKMRKLSNFSYYCWMVGILIIIL
jgi:undecaprenyl-diphosphatase